ncbi:hypothetical protein FF38_03147 [Lucilia cuprina]|uniref:Uncharacterized protein n=1 Tax=Lucilia cuprina TaxID=7375 RepID=A0A0L0CNC2_LUCCU|nr:hypothetical protein FF38_03147 [Lucilia cuprina]
MYMSKKINRKFMPKFIKCKIIEKIGNNLYGVEYMKGNLLEFGRENFLDPQHFWKSSKAFLKPSF